MEGDGGVTDIIPKIIGVILAFVLLVLAPVTITRMTDDMAAKRVILNEVNAFIDCATDKGSVTPSDIDDLYIAINSRGGAFDAQVARYVRIAVPSGMSDAESIYVATDDAFGVSDVRLREGDIIQVRVTSVERTTAQNMLAYLFRLYERDFEVTLAGMVR